MINGSNCFQGIFPNANSASDGIFSNGYGIYDMAGNVWEMVDPTGPKHPIELDHFHRTGNSKIENE